MDRAKGDTLAKSPGADLLDREALSACTGQAWAKQLQAATLISVLPTKSACMKVQALPVKSAQVQFYVQESGGTPVWLTLVSCQRFAISLNKVDSDLCRIGRETRPADYRGVHTKKPHQGPHLLASTPSCFPATQGSWGPAYGRNNLLLCQLP